MNGDTHPAGTSSALPSPPTSLSSTNRASPFAPLSNSMAPSAFTSSSQSAFRPALGAPTNVFASPIGAPANATSPQAMSSIFIQGLPLTTTEDSLRLMTVFSKDVIDVYLLPQESTDALVRNAIIDFASPAGALEAKNILDGKNVNNEGQIRVQVVPSANKRGNSPSDVSSAGGMNTPSVGSSAAPSRQPSRFAGTAFPPTLDATAAGPNSGIGLYGLNGITDRINDASTAHIFSDQSPIGNFMSDRSHATGKNLINRDTAEDDETGAIISNPIDFAENGSIAAQRRATAPQVPIDRMAGLSLSTTDITGSVPNLASPFSHHGTASLSGRHIAMSPGSMNPGPHLSGPVPMIYNGNYYLGQPPQSGHNGHHRGNHMPAVNPADMNPPCNTLYVGNLPIDTSEEELKSLFIRQRGYKRLCFRTKQNGPMCFVEFEDTSFAVCALQALYGTLLSNSVKGGIRLSFSKNPLGIRSGQNSNQHNGGPMNGMNGHMPGSSGAFTTASGPPPGLSAPPGMNSRMGYGAAPGASPWAGSSLNGNNLPPGSSPSWPGMHQGPISAGGHGSHGMMNGGGSGLPPYMLGR